MEQKLIEQMKYSIERCLARIMLLGSKNLYFYVTQGFIEPMKVKLFF